MNSSYPMQSVCENPFQKQAAFHPTSKQRWTTASSLLGWFHSIILEMPQTPAKARKVAGSKCSPRIPLTQWSDWHLPHHCPMPWVPAAASLVEGAKLSQEERYALSRGCRSQHESASGIQSHKANFGSIEVSNQFVIGVYFYYCCQE